jgi:hypothetical protein
MTEGTGLGMCSIARESTYSTPSLRGVVFGLGGLTAARVRERWAVNRWVLRGMAARVAVVAGAGVALWDVVFLVVGDLCTLRLREGVAAVWCLTCGFHLWWEAVWETCVLHLWCEGCAVGGVVPVLATVRVGFVQGTAH